MQSTDRQSQRHSPVARALTAVAAQLQRHATITHPVTGTSEPRCMSQGWLDTLLPAAIGAHTPTVPRWDRRTFPATVRATLPPVTGTVAEYAAILRTTAVNL